MHFLYTNSIPYKNDILLAEDIVFWLLRRAAASFLKKAGQKLLVSLLCFIGAFFTLPDRLDTYAGATIGRPLWFTGNFIRRLKAAQTFFGKSLTKNFFERLKGGGCRPHTPNSDQRLCLWNPQAFEKA